MTHNYIQCSSLNSNSCSNYEIITLAFGNIFKRCLTKSAVLTDLKKCQLQILMLGKTNYANQVIAHQLC